MYMKVQSIAAIVSSINPRTYIQTHPPTMVHGGTPPPPPPRVFVTLQYFEKFLLLIDSMLCSLQDDVNIMGYICK